MDNDERSTRFTRAISQIAGYLGSFPAILLAVFLVVTWIAGAFFVEDGFRNDLYQLIITAGTGVATFIMVFIIQNTQNRDDRATQTKLDAHARALRSILDHLEVAHDTPLSRLAGLEDAPETDIKQEQDQVRRKSPGSRQSTGEHQT